MTKKGILERLGLVSTPELSPDEKAKISALIQKYGPLQSGENKITALHMVERAEDVLLLLKAGAEIDAPTNEKVTPLIQAASEGKTEVALALIAAGADVKATTISSVTALHYACYNNNQELIKALIQQGADIKAKDGYGFTPEELMKNKSTKNKGGKSSTPKKSEQTSSSGKLSENSAVVKENQYTPKGTQKNNGR